MKLRKYILIIVFASLSVNLLAQGVAINEDNSNADASAILDIKSNDKGLLLPRMTNAERTAISTPALGLIVFQTDGESGFYYYNGTGWEAVNNMIKTYAAVSEAEAASGLDNSICYVIETETYYRYEETAGSYTVENKYILSTNDGGNTRWLGISGRYVLNSIMLDEIVHLDATSGSATITELNKIYYILGASSTTTVTIPDASADNEGWFLKLYKEGGNGTINIVTTSSQNIDGAATAQIFKSNKGIFIKSDNSIEWLKIQDSRCYIPVVKEVTSDFAATDDWMFDHMIANTNSGNITVTLPADISGFVEGDIRMFFNNGNNILYGDPNGNVIDGTSETRIVAPNGYIELQKLDGVIKIIREKNVTIKKNATDITNLVCWLDASQLSGSDNSNITTWTDLQNGYNFTGSSGEQPTLQTNEQNGKNIVRFDGNNDVLSAGDIELNDNSNGLSIVAVVRPYSEERMAVLSKYYTISNNREFAFGNQQNYLFEDGSWSDATQANLSMNINKFQIVEMIWEPGQAMQLFINGVLQDVGSKTVNDILDGSANLKLGGGDFTSVGFWNGDIAELMVYSDAISNSEREILRENLSVKWDIDEILIANGGGKYWKRDDNTNTLSPDVDNDNLNMGTGTVSASDYQFSDGGSTIRSVRQVVDAGTEVTMDNISVEIPTTGNRNLMIKAVSGSFLGNCCGNYTTGGVLTALTTNAVTYSTTYQYLLSSSWNYNLGGDQGVYMMNDTSNGRCYRITVQIGDAWLNNLIVIERLF